jgi:tRNA-dihydrouridine synthase
VDSIPFELCQEFDKLILRIIANTEAMEMEVGSSLLLKIRRGQQEDEKVQEIKRNIKEEKLPSFLVDCHNPILGNRTEASIRVPRMFKSHVWPTVW